MSNLVAKVGTFIISLFFAALSLFLLPLGLLAPPFLLFPLLLGMNALLAALSASWISTWLIAKQSYNRLLPIVGIAKATAAALAIVLLIWLEFGGRLLLPVIILFVGATLLITLSANVATWRYRSPERVLMNDILVTGGMVILGSFVFLGTYFLSALFGSG